ncbi:hypothetical protein ACHAPM_011671 [Fusarium culmorum]
MTVEQLLNFLGERNHVLALENGTLQQQCDVLNTSVDQMEAVLDWQQRLICLGEEHVTLLETILQRTSAETTKTTPPTNLLPSLAEHQFQQQICSSPLSTPPSLRLDSNQFEDDRSFAAVIPQDGYRPDLAEGHPEMLQRCAESEALAYLVSHC